MSDVHIACAFDRGMTIPALLLAYSVKKFANPSRKTIFHVLECEKSACPSYADYLLNSDNFEIRHHYVNLDIFKNYDLSIAAVPSLASFARLAIPALIGDAERVLYLDCDIVINHSLDALFEMQMEGFPLAACHDIMYADFMRGSAGPHNNASQILFKDTASYFNSGVMLIDCDRWRENKYSEAVINFLMNPPAPLYLPDQDALNAVFQNNYIRLDPRWNSRALGYGSIDDEKELSKQITCCAGDPWIIHFMGRTKPWISFHQRTEFHPLYWRLAAESPFLSELIALYKSGPRGKTAYAVGKLPAICSDRHVWEFLFTLSRAAEKVESAFGSKGKFSTRLGALGTRIHNEYLVLTEAVRGAERGL